MSENISLIKIPKISVITVVLNGINYIESTILSVINQDYLYIEYIIVDGGSTDGTLDIIRKYEQKISYWTSQKDRGIYDAMNKGIDLANGDWIIFMNCGDFFISNNILSKVFSTSIPEDVMIVYGGAFVRSSWGNFYIKANPENELWKGFTHQSLFSRTSICKKHKFNLQFHAAADYDFVYTVLSKKYKSLSLSLIVSNILYISTGHSSINEVCSKKEVLKSILLHKTYLKDFIIHYLYHWFALIRKYLSIFVRSFAPQLIQFIRKIRDKNKDE